MTKYHPFEASAFSTTGTATPQTLPARLGQQNKNVRDFGATGDGVTDDLAAIVAAFNWTTAHNRGTLFFPPGTYYVSAPIDISNSASVNPPTAVCLFGVMGLSVIVGDFADFVITRDAPDTTANGGGHRVEKLTIINRNASGGGIRLGSCVGAAIRDCDITANFGINTNNSGAVDLSGTLEIAIKNCHLRAYDTLASGSIGLNVCSDGPYTNLTISGYDIGMRLFGGEGAMDIQGCYFEGNNTALSPGAANYFVSGCRFKNNGIAINGAGTNGVFAGLLIEGNEGGITGNPQYGIKIIADAGHISVFQGIVVTGQFQQAGVYVQGGSQFAKLNTFHSVSSINTSTLGGVNWLLPTTPATASFVECNVASVFSVAGLPAQTSSITSLTWSAGVATVQFSYVGTLVNGATVNFTIAGVTPSGYNGTFVGMGTGAVEIQFPLASDPGGSGTGGTIFYSNGDAKTQNVYEGQTFNVSDANASSWGALVTAGGGSTHAKLRYTPTAWTVAGV